MFILSDRLLTPLPHVKEILTAADPNVRTSFTRMFDLCPLHLTVGVGACDPV